LKQDYYLLFPFRVLFSPSLFSVALGSCLFMDRLKKGKVDFCGFRLAVYRFRSIRMITSPITTIAMIMPVDTGRKYMSATDAGVGVGGGVAAGGSSTFMAVSA